MPHVIQENTMYYMAENKRALKTVRLSFREEAKINEYLKKNPIFNGFSALARAAVLAFIEQEQLTLKRPNPSGSDSTSSHLNPIEGHIIQQRPYFLPEQNVTEDNVRHILKNGSEIEQISIMSRLLSEASWKDVWTYTTPQAMTALFSKLWFWPDSKREIWHAVLEEWKETGELVCPKELAELSP